MKTRGYDSVQDNGYDSVQTLWWKHLHTILNIFYQLPTEIVSKLLSGFFVFTLYSLRSHNSLLRAHNFPSQATARVGFLYSRAEATLFVHFPSQDCLPRGGWSYIKILLATRHFFSLEGINNYNTITSSLSNYILFQGLLFSSLTLSLVRISSSKV